MLPQDHKEALPGYTGYIPQKFEMLGATMGKISKMLVEKTEPINCSGTTRTLYNKVQRGDVLKAAAKQLYGFKSSQQNTWAGGPMDSLYAQQIPGYGGFIPGSASENVYGKSYAAVSRKSIYRNATDREFTAFQRFKTTQMQSYKNPKAKYSVDGKNTYQVSKDISDFQGYNDSVNLNKSSITYNITKDKMSMIKNAAPNLPIVGYTGHLPGVVSNNTHSTSFRGQTILSRNYQIKSNTESRFLKK